MASNIPVPRGADRVRLSWNSLGALRGISAACVLCWITAAVFLQVRSASADDIQIHWTIQQPLRLFQDADAEALYRKDVKALNSVRQIFGAGYDQFVGSILDHEFYVRGNAPQPKDYITRTYYDRKTDSYKSNWAQNPAFTISVWLTGLGPQQKDCVYGFADGERKFINGYFAPVKAPCATAEHPWVFNTAALSQPNKAISLHLTVKAPDGQLYASGELKPRDYLIVTLGDSYASGEGSPDVPVTGARSFSDTVLSAYGLRPYFRAHPNEMAPARWWDQRCHRSLFSGSALAVVRLVDRLEQGGDGIHASFTYMNLACSGASIYDGLLTGYIGREIRTQIVARNAGLPPRIALDEAVSEKPLTPQVEALAQTLCKEWDPGKRSCDNGYGRTPDVLFVSIGGNDIGFGGVIRHMLAGVERTPKQYDAMKTVLGKSLAALPSLFGLFDARVAGDSERSLKLQASHIILSEYPDLLSARRESDGKQQICSDVLVGDRLMLSDLGKIFSGVYSRSIPMLGYLAGMSGLTEQSATYAHEEVYRPLLRAIQTAGKNNSGHRWQTVSDFDDNGVSAFERATFGHGVCTNLDAWTLNYEKTMRIQGKIAKIKPLPFKSVENLDEENGAEAIFKDNPDLAQLVAAMNDAKMIARIDAKSWKELDQTKGDLSYGGIPSGLFHPNYLGYRSQANYIALAINRALGLSIDEAKLAAIDD